MLWGLGYLHYEHHMHRDVKPQNVLLNRRALSGGSFILIGNGDLRVLRPTVLRLR